MRGVALQGGGGAGQDGAPTGRFAQQTPFPPAPRAWKTTVLNFFPETRTIEILCKLTSGPTLVLSLQTRSMQGMSGSHVHARHVRESITRRGHWHHRIAAGKSKSRLVRIRVWKYQFCWWWWWCFPVHSLDDNNPWRLKAALSQPIHGKTGTPKLPADGPLATS